MSLIFLSHSSKDNVIAGRVKAWLEHLGHRSVFLDFDPEDGIPAGRDWEKELYAQLRDCRAVIVLCSHASMASHWCFAEITHAKALGKDVLPIKIDDCKVDPILTGKQVINATTDWNEAYQRLANGLLKARLDPHNQFDWDGTRAPYPGLPAFQEEDAAIFFGREKEIREGLALLNRLQQFGGPRLTLMLGASGSGKSSLMRAGLLPRLKRDQRWVVVEPFRPLKTPFDELALALSKRFNPTTEAENGAQVDVAHIRERIRWEEHDTKKSVDASLELLKGLRERVGSREATMLLVIDQCEELLTLGANDEGHQFLAFLRAVLDREDSRFMVLATLRSDFLGSFQDHPAMRGLSIETFPVPQMRVDDFASVIEGPAKIAGLELGPGLVQAMISDTKTSDALPLLAFTLCELYVGFGQSKRLTFEEYSNKLGRLDGCIARAAEAVLCAKPLSETELSDLQNAFLSMVRVADNDQYAKQPVRWNDLSVSTHDVLEKFVTVRLLMSSEDENGRTLEVAHEALFRAWPRMVRWLEDNKSFLVWQQRLKTIRKDWDASKRSVDLLLHGLPLREAEEWLKKNPKLLLADESEFVAVSQNRRTKERVISVIGIALVLWVISGTIWLWQKGYNLDQAVLKVQSFFFSIHVLPQLVEIQGGTFQQGDLERLGESWRSPVRPVTVRPFVMGQYEVTFEEYDHFAIAKGRSLPSDEGWGRGRRPVINVSWEDVKAYVEWLSWQAGQHFRLPTESEWEYAARSGTKQQVWAGTSEESQLGGYAVFSKNSGSRTEEVGKKEKNGFGLYDMSGNVSERLEDCWHENYKEAPQDGSVWLETKEGNCNRRVVRGGSWDSSLVELQASYRYRSFIGVRTSNLGFRLAKDIDP